VARKGRARRFREARAFKQGFGDRPLDEALLGDIISPVHDGEDDDDEDDDEVDDDDPYADLYEEDEDDDR
jgi:hypothetical protein